MISRRYFFGALLSLPLTGIFLFNGCATGKTTKTISLPQRGLCAHRGCAETFPENTLPAFQEAVRLGVQMVEFDVRETKDGALVLMHDADVNRTTDGKGKISDLTLAEIRKLDAGIRKSPQFAGTRVPTLEELLNILPKNIWLNCDLKGSTASLGEKTARLIIKQGRQHQAFLACEATVREAARKIDPNILICNMERKKTSREYVDDTIKVKAQFIQMSYKFPFSQNDLLPLKEHHIRAGYYFAKKPSEMESLFEKGIDFVLVNNPSDFFPAAHKFGILPVVPEY